MKRLILVDTSALAKTPVTYGAYFSMKKEDGTEYETTTLFNLFQIFKKIPSLNDTIIFCCDRKTMRKDMQNDYKSGRKKNSDSYKQQLKDAERELAECGFIVSAKDGYEADDLIAYYSTTFKNNYDEVLIYTNDSDISNVLDIEGKIKLRKISKYSKDADVFNFEQEFDIPFNTTLLYKATVGDTTDKVKGVMRFGKKKFKGLLDYAKEKGYKFEDIRLNEQEEEIIRGYFTKEEQLEQALHSLKMVTPIIEGLDMEIEGGVCDKAKVKSMLEKYQMKSIVRYLKL